MKKILGIIVSLFILLGLASCTDNTTLSDEELKELESYPAIEVSMGEDGLLSIFSKQTNTPYFVKMIGIKFKDNESMKKASEQINKDLQVFNSENKHVIALEYDDNYPQDEVVEENGMTYNYKNAYVHFIGRNLNLEMIQKGYATAEKDKEYRYKDLFLKSEK